MTPLDERADLWEARERAVRQTLRNVGAPTHDERGRALTANGMLVDWLAGRRQPGWTGPDDDASRWAELLVKRDGVQGAEVLRRMIAWYEEHDGKADDFGELFIVKDARRALTGERHGA
jgi:hypothetical protein